MTKLLPVNVCDKHNKVNIEGAKQFRNIHVFNENNLI